MAQQWQIWIDTGGTFTDCIALQPNGAPLRCKVLSNSCLRGKLLAEQPQRGAYQITQRWGARGEIFADYYARLPRHPELGLRRVLHLDPLNHQLILDHPFPITLPVDFEITAFEEAPTLAMRIITNTPLHQPFPPCDLRLGFTKGTNALLERKGVDPVLLITQGLGDLLAIGTQQRPHLFQLDIPPPWLPYQEVIEVEERIDAQGRVLQPLSAADAARIAGRVKALGVQTVAVALLHSYRNPVHENILGQALAAAGISYIALSHRVSPALKLLPRAQTTAVDAYLQPIINNYLDQIQASIATSGPNSSLRIMISAGGLTHRADFLAKDSLLSGPAGGLVGAVQAAKNWGFSRVLTFDMGGTSTDVARFDGTFDYRFVSRINGLEVQCPTLAIETVAAGGGSRCFFAEKRLMVGPESAGADPGPACYGTGGPLTLTDVNLLLGRLAPEGMGLPMHAELAQAALRDLMETITTETGEIPNQMALLQGLVALADEKMAEAVRKISVARGFNPADYALVAFGGAGGLHACRVAEILGMQTILLPFDGGLLSAKGIGAAAIERHVQQQVLQPWAAVALHFEQWLAPLVAAARQRILAEGFSADQVVVRGVLLSLRWVGQENTLEIALKDPTTVPSDFSTAYHRIYGYAPEHQELELESVKVIASTLSSTSEPTVPRTAGQPVVPERFLSHPLDQSSVAVYQWEHLQAGDTLIGPAVVIQANSTAFLPAGWQAVAQVGGDLMAQPGPSLAEINRNATHPAVVEQALFTNRFTALAEEMGFQLQRTAISVNVRERLDFSCALLNPRGQLLANAPHIPVHLGSLGICARLVLEKYPLEPGDVILTNHPRYGGSHLPDLTLLSGVFSPEGQCLGYVINRAHHAEIGGKTPGSMPPDATHLFEEGVIFPPTYLVKAGKTQWDQITAMLQGAPYPSRAIRENLADLHAALAAQRSGEQALQKLVADQGWEKTQHYMQGLLDHSARVMAEIIQEWGEQTHSATEFLDDGRRLQVTIYRRQQELIFDFQGTDERHPHNLNANIAIVYSVVLYVLRLLCGQELPLNDGLMRDIKIKLPPNSLLHPDFPDDPIYCPAVVGGNTEVSQRLVDLLLKALGLVACSQGTMNNFLFGNEQFGYYETIGGGAGAGPGFSGRSAVHQHMTNTKITDVEELELRYPIRVKQFGIRRGSGGTGEWPGGDGIIRAVTFLTPLTVTLLSQHRQEQPYGLAGGQPGQPGQQTLFTADGQTIALPGIAQFPVAAFDSLELLTPGGGGYGEPRPK